MYVLKEFSTADCSCTVQENIFEKTIIEVRSPHLPGDLSNWLNNALGEESPKMD